MPTTAKYHFMLKNMEGICLFPDSSLIHMTVAIFENHSISYNTFVRVTAYVLCDVISVVTELMVPPSPPRYQPEVC
jgi:hypothetical protein